MIYVNIVLNFLKKIGNKCIPFKDMFIMLVLIAIIFFCCNKSSKVSTLVGKPQLQSVTSHIDKQGNIVSAIPIKTYTQEDVNLLTDSIKKVWNVKGKVKYFTQYVDRVDTNLKPKPFFIDTAKGTIYAHDFGIYYDISFNGNSKTQIGNFHLSLTDDTVTYLTTHRHFLFKPDVDSISIQHSNKLIKTTLGESYTVQEKKPVLVVSPYVGYGYDFTTNSFKPSVGISVGYVLFTIKSK